MSAANSPAMQPQLNDMSDSGFLQQQQGSSAAFRLPRRVFVGQIVTPVSLTSLKLIKRGLIGVGSSGIIRFVVDLDKLDQETLKTPPPATPNVPGADDETHAQPTPRRAAFTSSAIGIEVPTDEDRSATPVNIPGRAAKRNHLMEPSESVDMTLPPPALGDVQDSGYLSEERNEEQALIEQVVGAHGWRLQECETILLNVNSFLCPGFIDTHIHAPQVPNLGRGQQYELLDWLENITFPRERKFEDPLYARQTYESVVQRMLDSGTTCAAMYGTLHEEATMILAHICNERGMRAFIGKCQMDRNAPVDYKEKNSAASMESTKRFVNYCRNMKPYGMPNASTSNDPLLSSGSAEMDESIARLSATMKSIMDESRGRPASLERLDSAQTDVNGNATPPATSLSSADAKPSGLPMAAPSGNTSKNHLHRNSSLSSSHASGTSEFARGRGANGGGGAHSARHSSTSGSGHATPKRLKEVAERNAKALVQPILTPRFAIGCSDALLASISALMSRDGSLRVQTHLSENAGEISYTKELFPFCETYTDVYEHFSLLTPRTILAHAIHLSDDEMALIQRRKCGISHCPTSNLNLRSGASRLGELLNRGIKVGLGTDMSGGFGMSMLTAIRDASIVAKVLQFPAQGENTPAKAAATSATSVMSVNADPATPLQHGDSIEDKPDFCTGPLSIATLFYLATLGGAEVCNIESRVGSLEQGKEFDAILFNCDNSNPNLYIEPDDDLEAKVEKTLFCADDRNIASVFVRGRVVGGSAPIN